MTRSHKLTPSRFALVAWGLLLLVVSLLPVVSAVDGADKIGLHQTGVLLALPAPRGPACAARERKEEMEERLGDVCLFLYVVKKAP